MDSDRDLVERALSPSRDLYDIATWEQRTRFDRLSVQIYRLITATSRVLIIGAALLILAAQIAITGYSLLRSPTLGILTLLSVVPALVLAGYIWYDDPTLRQSLRSLVVTFLLGILLASFAGIINSLFSPLFELIPIVGLALFFFLIVGPIEEFVKWLAIRLYAYGLEEFHAVIDGAIYGAVAGLGFATIENLLYISDVYLQVVDLGVNILPSTIGITSVRALAGPGHVIYSAFAGYYLGLAKFNPEQRGPIIVKGLLLAALVHGAYNTLVSYLPTIIPLNLFVFVTFILVFDGLLLFVLLGKLARYRSAYHESLTKDRL